MSEEFNLDEPNQLSVNKRKISSDGNQESKKIKKIKKNKTKKFMIKMSQFKQPREYIAKNKISELYFIHLLHRYHQRCFVDDLILNIPISIEKNTNIDELFLMQLFEHNKSQYNNTNVLKQIQKCIENGVEVIIIPVNLQINNDGHANVLIYRSKDNTIEHYEPHGANFLKSIDSQFQSSNINDIIFGVLTNFVKALNELTHTHISPITFIRGSYICPYENGFQNLESKYNDEFSGGGYCAPWSLYFIESVFRNPQYNSIEVYKKLWNRFETELSKNEFFLRDFIRGYVNKIYVTVENDFYKATKYKFHIEEIIQLINLEDRKKYDIFNEIYVSSEKKRKLKIMRKFLQEYTVVNRVLLNRLNHNEKKTYVQFMSEHQRKENLQPDEDKTMEQVLLESLDQSNLKKINMNEDKYNQYLNVFDQMSNSTGVDSSSINNSTTNTSGGKKRLFKNKRNKKKTKKQNKIYH